MPVNVEILAFDVFGTLVDWRTSMTAALERVGDATGLEADWAAVADSWRSRYHPVLASVLRGEMPYRPLDELHRIMLDQVAEEHGLEALGDAERDELVLGWHRLDPWPDAAPGLTALRERHILTTLSNGGVGLLTRLAKAAGLPFDCILSAELAESYKPDPRVYGLVSDFFRVPPDRVLMVACHPGDLSSAARCGLRTAFIPRPAEWGPGGHAPEPPPGADLVAPDLIGLAAML
jgi:2-haloacid dehalogenase